MLPNVVLLVATKLPKALGAGRDGLGLLKAGVFSKLKNSALN